MIKEGQVSKGMELAIITIEKILTAKVMGTNIWIKMAIPYLMDMINHIFILQKEQIGNNMRFKQSDD